MTMIFVGGCETSTGDFCDIYIPVPTLDAGRAEQRIAIDKNNAYHMEKCT